MWTAIIFAGLAIAMMLGPIMMMQPSKRQRRLANLRSAAERRGLRVRMAPLPDKGYRAGEELAVYNIAWPEKKGSKTTWVLARQPFSHGLHFAGEWDWAGRDAAPATWCPALLHALEEVPAGVLAIEASRASLGAYWSEATGGREPEQAVAELAEWLRELRDQLPLVSLPSNSSGTA